MYLAWHVAAFSRVKEMPALDKVLGNRTAEDDPKKGAEAIKAALMAYSAGYQARQQAAASSTQ